jgi:3-oxoadipate enol-lactonase
VTLLKKVFDLLEKQPKQMNPLTCFPPRSISQGATTMPFATNKTIRLAYEEKGKGEPVLLIMGYAARSAHWGEEFRELLAAQHRVVSFDNRGTGDSDKPAQGWTMRDMAEDAFAVMKEASMAAAHVIGISMGGMIAQELALTHAECVRTLTLIATHSGGPEVAPPAQAATDALIHPDRTLTVTKMVENIWRTICAPGFLDSPGRLEACLRLDLDKPTPVQVMAHQARAITGSDRSGYLCNIKVPTLIITGTHDSLMPPANSERLASLIPGSKLVHIANCGHMVPLEKPRELSKAILEFLPKQY